MSFSAAVLNGRGTIAVAEVAKELASVLRRSCRIFYDDKSSFESKARWLLIFLRELWRVRRQSFDEETLTLLKSCTDTEQIRHTVAKVFDPSKDEFYIVAPKAFIRVTRFESQLSWVGVNGLVYPYRREDLKRDMDYHASFMNDIVRVFDAIDCDLDARDSVDDLLRALRALYERAFLARRKRLGLQSAHLIDQNSKQHRVTKCWYCHSHLETGVYMECSMCGWLVCSCGACGCGKDSL